MRADTCKAHIEGKTTGWPHVADYLPEPVITAVRKVLGIVNDPIIALDDDDDYGFSIGTLASVEPQMVSWLWPYHLAKGKMHQLGGDTGVGKTTVGLSFAAIGSVAGKWPNDVRALLFESLIWSGEDDFHDTIVPRLMAMGADLSKIHRVCPARVQGKTIRFNPAKHMDELTTILTQGIPGDSLRAD